MRIEKCLGATREEIESKKFNIWIGISLGNKYFTKENIKKYILWALENTKEDVLVVIADRLYAIKMEALDNYGKLRAIRVSSRFGNEKEKEIKDIISNLPENKRKLVKVVRFKDAINTKYYEYRLELLQEFYKNNSDFKEYINKIVKTIYQKTRLDKKRIETLSKYALKEIPLFLNGANLNDSTSKGKYYRCIIYPGLGDLDFLVMGLHSGKMFPELSKKLYIKEQIAIVEGYVD